VSPQPLEASPIQSTALAGDTSADAAYLLTVIEKQPSCLLRVGIDGRLLAANRSALRLLGTGDLAQALDRTLTERILPAHRERWRDFLTRVWEIGSGSIECDMTDVAGVQRTLLLDGVALREHPDSNRSMLMGARDASAGRRLEKSLEEDEASRVQEREAQRRQLETAHAMDRARLQQTLAEERQLALMLKEREGRQMLDGMRAELEQARAEHQRLTAAHGVDRAQLQHSLAEEHHLALLLQEGEHRQILDAARCEMERTLAESQRLEAELHQRNGDLRHLVESLAAAGRTPRDVGWELQTAVGSADPLAVPEKAV
jgi:hypothetical protein